jgi:two-component system NarL family sensor kinase
MQCSSPVALARELLQNAARHAQAGRVRLDVVRDGPTVVLRCADDGRGCADVHPDASLRNGHLGLSACTERVRAVGGTLELTSAPGRGTIVRATLPSEVTATVSAFL